MQALPITAIVPTRDRTAPLERTLISLCAQGYVPEEIIIIDASNDNSTRQMLERLRPQFPVSCDIRWVPAEMAGAAIQRNQGCALTARPNLWFFDDDIVLHEECLLRLWMGLNSDAGLGGVNAMITNQRYHPPGLVSSTLFGLLNGKREPTYAGRVLGPAVNLLPEDREDLPEIVPTDWLNSTCTLYRREALPQPPFDSMFTGYSMMEDLTLSLRVGRNWKLANVRTARIFHDSQPGAHKSDARALSCMELVNRHYVMTKVLDRTRLRDYARLALWEAFQLAIGAWTTRLGRPFWLALSGKLRAVRNIVHSPVVPTHATKR